MRAPNAYKRDAARVNSITGRSANVSRERLDIEQFLEQLGPNTERSGAERPAGAPSSVAFSQDTNT